MRIALFGGSFDPPHLGHLHIALTAARRLHLDRILLAPAGRQPLKSHHLTAFSDRLAMLSLLVAGHPQLQVSDIDAPQAGPNYTADTLARLRSNLPRPTLPPGTELFFLAGADSFLTLRKWHRAEALLRPAASGGLLDGWILAARPGFPLAALVAALPPGYTVGEAQVESMPEPGPVLTRQLLTRQLHDPTGAPATPLYLLPDLDDPSTATRIRQALAAGEPAPHLAPQIARYIHDHDLYRMLG